MLRGSTDPLSLPAGGGSHLPHIHLHTAHLFCRQEEEGTLASFLLFQAAPPEPAIPDEFESSVRGGGGSCEIL